MSKATKIWLIAASVLVLCGAILFFGVMAYLDWDFEKLSTVEYETNEHEIGEGFEDILVITDTADIVFVKSENEKTTVVCREEKNGKHLVAVKDGVLIIKLEDTKSWYDHIGINFETSKITVYLPEGEYGGLSVKLSTGDVDMSGGFAFEDGICVDVSTGDVRFENITCKSLTSNGSTGDIRLKKVVAAEAFEIKRSTGDVTFDACDASVISVKTATGDVEGSFISEKIVFAQTDTGRVNVPVSQAGGRCDIITDTGDIKIIIAK